MSASLETTADGVHVLEYRPPPLLPPRELDVAKRYANLQYIDWNSEYSRERRRRAELLDKQRFADTSVRWLAVLALGVLVGIAAASMDILAMWLHNIRFGRCTHGFHLTRQVCCLGIDPGDACPAWRGWGDSIGSSAALFAFRYFLYTLLAVVLAAATVVLMRFAPMAVRLGVLEARAIMSGLVLSRFLSMRVLAAKVFGLVMVVSGGLWVGKEGPLVHVAVCVAEAVALWVPLLGSNEALKRELYAAAAAAGIAVAFNAPIGGVLFVVEQASTTFFVDRGMWRAFVGAGMAVVVFQVFRPFSDGNTQLFLVARDNLWLWFELMPFVLLGVFGGVYGWGFSRVNDRIRDMRERLVGTGSFRALNLAFEAMMLAAVLAVTQFPLLFARFQLLELVTRLFQDCQPLQSARAAAHIVGGLCANHEVIQWKTLLLLVLTWAEGFALTTYLFGAFIPGGVLMPLLALGAIVGRAAGILMQHVELTHSTAAVFRFCADTNTCILPGLYAVVGGAAFMAGVTKMPVLTVVIVFELTGALTYVLPIMVAVLVARVVLDRLGGRGCYNPPMSRSHIPVLNPLLHPLPSTPTLAIMKPAGDLAVVYTLQRYSFAELAELAGSWSYQYFPAVVSPADGRFQGFVSRTDLLVAVAQAQDHRDPGAAGDATFGTPAADAPSDTLSLHHLVEPPHTTVPASLPLPLLVRMFTALNILAVAVASNGVLEGLVAKRDVVALVERADSLANTGHETVLAAVREHPRDSSDPYAYSARDPLAPGLVDDFDISE